MENNNFSSVDTIGDDDGFELLNDLLMREEDENNDIVIDLVDGDYDLDRNMGIEVEPSPGSSVSSSNRKVISPLYTDYSTDTSHPSLGSARGIDSGTNQLIYSSSQTPHGFNVITKRKSTKKSVFNFEELDLSNIPQGQSSISPKSSDPMVPDTGRSLGLDNASSSEDSPEVLSRRILRTRNRNRFHQHEVQLHHQQERHSLTEIDNFESLIPKIASIEEYKEYDEDFKNQLETAGSLQALTLDTGADLDWSLLCDGTLGVILQSPTPRNPRKKQDPGFRGNVEEDPGIEDQEVLQEVHYGINQQSFPSTEFCDSNGPYDPKLDSSPYPPNSNHQFTNQHQSLEWDQSQLNSMGPMYDAPLYVKPEFQISLPSISALQANSALLGAYNNQFPPVPSAPAVTDSSYSLDVPLNITISNTALPLASALNDIVSYQNMVNRKVQEMKFQQHNQYSNIIIPNQNFHQLTQSSRPVGNSSSNTATLQYAVHIPGGQQSASKKSNSSTSSSKRTTMVTKVESGDEDEDSNVTAKKGSTGSSRASKSLAEISRRFVTLYGKDNTMDYISGLIDPDDITDAPLELHRVDGAADALGVHVRRIYELIKILEILSLVTFAGDKRGKFSWRGTKDFLYTLGNIQNDGITNFPQLAAQNGLTCPEVTLFHKSVSNSSISLDVQTEGPNRPTPYIRSDSTEVVNQFIADSITSLDLDSIPTSDLLMVAEDSPFKNAIRNTNFFEKPEPGQVKSAPAANHEEHFMVEIICRRFLQLFLVGMNSLSMSSAIQKLIPLETGQSLADYNKVNATKIRRVYDVTNVLCSLNLIRKKTIPKSKALKAEMENNIDCGGTIEQGDLTDDCESQGGSVINSKKGGGTTKGSGKVGDRADTKVLEWTSFPPLVIRKKYLPRIQGLEKKG